MEYQFKRPKIPVKHTTRITEAECAPRLSTLINRRSARRISRYPIIRLPMAKKINVARENSHQCVESEKNDSVRFVVNKNNGIIKFNNNASAGFEQATSPCKYGGI